jgi:hypothetical protein
MQNAGAAGNPGSSCEGYRQYVNRRIPLAEEYLRKCGMGGPPLDPCPVEVGDYTCIGLWLKNTYEWEDRIHNNRTWSCGGGVRADTELKRLAAQVQANSKATAPNTAGSNKQQQTQSEGASKQHLRADDCVEIVRGNHMRNRCSEPIQVSYCYARQKKGTYGVCGNPPQGQLLKGLAPGKDEWMPEFYGGRVEFIACRGRLGEVSPVFKPDKRGCF